MERTVRELPLEAICNEGPHRALVEMAMSARAMDNAWDWDVVWACFGDAYDTYVGEMEIINAKFDELDQRRIRWLEGAAAVDAARAQERVRKGEKWISLAQQRLKELEQGLERELDVVRGVGSGQ